MNLSSFFISLDFETKAPAWIHTMAQPNLSNNEIPYAYHSKGFFLLDFLLKC